MNKAYLYYRCIVCNREVAVVTNSYKDSALFCLYRLRTIVAPDLQPVFDRARHYLLCVAETQAETNKQPSLWELVEDKVMD